MIARLVRQIPASVRMALGGRQKVLQAHAALIHTLRAELSMVRFTSDAGTPVLEVADAHVALAGFGNDPTSLQLYRWLKPALPTELPVTHFRLLRDYVTRWIYPHMRPDLGPIAFPVNQRQGFHGQHKDTIAEYPDTATRSRLMAAFLPGPNDVVIDCGAFIGFGAVRMSRDAPHGRVIAIEASRACHDLLSRNVTRNAATSVTPLHNAVWNIETDLNLETTTAQGNSLLDEVVVGTGREKVRTVTIDGLVARHGLTRVDMLSITLNGAEIEALEGAERTLRELRPRIRAAGWYTRNGQRIAELLPPILHRHGYETFVGPRGNVLALPPAAA